MYLKLSLSKLCGSGAGALSFGLHYLHKAIYMLCCLLLHFFQHLKGEVKNLGQ